MISIVGIGPGERAFMTQAALQAVEDADVLVGWPRALAQFPDFSGTIKTMGGDIHGMVTWLKQNEHKKIAVLASGDPMLFGIGKRLCDAFPAAERRVVSGISAVQYLFARIGMAMNDVYITSSHGKTPNYDLIFQHDNVAMVTDKVIGPGQIAGELVQRGGGYSMIIGEYLSYPEEKIHYLTPSQLSDITEKKYGLTVVVLLNER